MEKALAMPLGTSANQKPDTFLASSPTHIKAPVIQNLYGHFQNYFTLGIFQCTVTSPGRSTFILILFF